LAAPDLAVIRSGPSSHNLRAADWVLAWPNAGLIGLDGLIFKGRWSLRRLLTSMGRNDQAPVPVPMPVH
jgi:hypothetical protein